MEMTGILVFEDVEELDFVGPLEVFATPVLAATTNMSFHIVSGLPTIAYIILR